MLYLEWFNSFSLLPVLFLAGTKAVMYAVFKITSQLTKKLKLLGYAASISSFFCVAITLLNQNLPFTIPKSTNTNAPRQNRPATPKITLFVNGGFEENIDNIFSYLQKKGDVKVLQ